MKSVIKATCTKNGEVFYYTRRSGRHDIARERIAAHEFDNGADAHREVVRLHNGHWDAGLTLEVVPA